MLSLRKPLRHQKTFLLTQQWIMQGLTMHQALPALPLAVKGVELEGLALELLVAVTGLT